MIIQTLELRVDRVERVERCPPGGDVHVDTWNVDSWVPGEPIDVDVEFLRPLLRDHGPWALAKSGEIYAQETRSHGPDVRCCIAVHLMNERAWDTWADAVPAAFRFALYRANDNDTERGHDPNLRAFLLDACGLT